MRLLEVEGRTVIERVLDVSTGFGDRVLISNDALLYAYVGVRTLGDVEVGRGAPAGLVTALLTSTTPWVLVCGCDMPFVTQKEVARLIALTTPPRN